MEQLIVFILFYILYAVFQMFQRRMGGNKKQPPKPVGKSKSPSKHQQPARTRGNSEQPESKMPEFLRRWMEEARRLEEEAQLKEQNRPATPATVLDFEVPDDAETAASEQKSIAKAAELANRKKISDKRRAVLLSQFDIGQTQQGTANNRRSQVIELLGKPESFKNALLLQEILSRPVSLRRRAAPYFRQG